MRRSGKAKGFSLIEIMIAVAIFSLAITVIFGVLSNAQRSMKYEVDKDSVAGGTTKLVELMGRDVRESSYPYIFTGDWLATSGTGGVSIAVSRNYFSASPLLGGSTLVPGVSNEGWAQCPNPVCGWCTRQDGASTVPVPPKAYLSWPVRNNGQTGSASIPPASLQRDDGDAKGRLYNHLLAGEPCPTCGSTLEAEAYISGLLVFSPRKANNTFSYGGAGDREVRWESLVFYCPFRIGRGQSEMRRYQFYASTVDPNASLIDLLDFDSNGIIESPPMTDGTGNFVEWTSVSPCTASRARVSAAVPCIPGCWHC